MALIILGGQLFSQLVLEFVSGCVEQARTCQIISNPLLGKAGYALDSTSQLY